MRTSSRIGAVGAAVALAASAAAFTMIPAGAAGSFTSAITGQLNLTTGAGASALDVSSGSLFSGSYDADAGTLTGDVGLGGSTFTANVAGIGDVPVSISFTSGGPIQNGTVDADAGTVSFTDTETVNLDSATVAGNAIPLGSCSVGPVTLNYTGSYDPNSGDIDVKSNTADVPELAGDCAGLAGTIGPMLKEATVVGELQFKIGTSEGPPPTVTTVPGATTVPGTPTTTPPPVSETTFTGPFTTNGCDATIPIHFGASGDYTVQITTTNDRVLGTTKVHRDAAGNADVVVKVDPNHGTKHGDPLNVSVKDASGKVIAAQNGTVDDPDACKPTTTTKPGSTTKPLATGTAKPAAAVTATPKFTG